MKIVPIALLLLAAPLAAAADDVTARKNYGAELAGCSAFYAARAAAPDVGPQQREDLQNKSHTALSAAARITDNKFAMIQRDEALAKPETINGALCDQVMAHPNERFAYWRGQ